MTFYIVGVAVIFGGSALVYFLSARFSALINRWFYIALAILFGLVLYIPAAEILKYSSLHMYADVSHWLQVLYNLGIAGIPLSPNSAFSDPDFGNYFAAHFVPFIYFFALPFKLLPRAETIFVLNFLLMFSAIIPLYKLALHFSKDRLFARVVAVAFLWYPSFQYITLYEFEMLRFSIPILFWMLYLFETRRTVLYAVLVLAAALAREEVGLTILMFGLYAWLFRKQKRLGIITAIFGLAMFFIIVSAVMPAFNTLDSFAHQVAAGSLNQWGSSLSEISINILTHPARALTTILSVQKFANVLMLFVPLLLIPFLASGALLGTLAAIGIGLISVSPLHNSYMLYYISPAIPFIFYAFIKAWPRLISLSLWERVGVRVQTQTPFMCAVLAGVLLSNIWFGPSPISLQFWFKDLRPAPFRTQDFHWSVYLVNNHQRNAERFVRMIPDDAVVSANEFLVPRLFKKKGAMVFPRLQSEDGLVRAEYVLLDITHNGLPPESPVVFKVVPEIPKVMNSPKQWQLLHSDGAFFLYERIADGL